jgi:hypothetical protein
MRIPVLPQPSSLQRRTRPNGPFSAALGVTFDTSINSMPPSICERPGKKGRQELLIEPHTHPSKARSMVQLRVFPPALVPPPLSRCLFFLVVLTGPGPGFGERSSHSGTTFIVLASPKGSIFSGNEAVAACDVFKWSIVAFQHTASSRLTTSSCVRRHQGSPSDTSHYPASYHPPHPPPIPIPP